MRIIIWDLDGTLVDSVGDICDAANAARRAVGLSPLPEPVVAGYVGNGVDQLIARLVPEVALQPVALHAYEHAYADGCCRRTAPYPGIVVALDRLRAAGYVHACATNKPLGFTRRILAHTGLDQQITAVRGGDGPRKPDPAQLISIVAELGGQAQDAWMIGDHHTDLHAATNAGCRAAFCQWGIGRRADAHALFEAKDPEQLVERILAHG